MSQPAGAAAAPRPFVRAPKYSIVIPTFNRAHHLSVTVESLVSQEVDFPYEIIIVDNNSSDGTRGVARALEQKYTGKVRYAHEPRQGTSLARNTGIAAASGEVIAFVDDDVLAAPTWLAALSETYRTHPDAWSVGGKIVLDRGDVAPAWFDPASKVLMAYLSCLDLGDATVELHYPTDLWGANFSVRRDALDTIGAFDPAFGWTGMADAKGTGPRVAGEDTEMCLRIYRAGGSIYYCGRAVVTHMIPASRMRKQYFRRRAYGGGRTAALLFPGYRDRSPWRSIAGLAGNIVKDCLWMLKSYAAGDVRGAFEHELTGWLWWGRLQQTLLNARQPRQG